MDAVFRDMNDNFDEQNIDAIKRRFYQDRASGSVPRSVFTMLQSNTSHPANISAESRRKCAEALLR